MNGSVDPESQQPITNATPVKAEPASPPPTPHASATTTPSPSDASVQNLMSMGFEEHDCRRALAKFNNAMDRAADWLINGMPETTTNAESNGGDACVAALFEDDDPTTTASLGCMPGPMYRADHAISGRPFLVESVRYGNPNGIGVAVQFTRKPDQGTASMIVHDAQVRELAESLLPPAVCKVCPSCSIEVCHVDATTARPVRRFFLLFTLRHGLCAHACTGALKPQHPRERADPGAHSFNARRPE